VPQLDAAVDLAVAGRAAGAAGQVVGAEDAAEAMTELLGVVQAAGQGAEPAGAGGLGLPQGQRRVHSLHLAREVHAGPDRGRRDAARLRVLIIALAEVAGEVGADVSEHLAVLQVPGPLRRHSRLREETVKQESPRAPRQPVRLLDAG